MAAQVSATLLMSQVCDEDTEEVFTVSLLANILYSGKPIDYHKPFREQAKKSFRLDDETIDRLLERVNVEVANATEFFGIKIGGTPSIPELLQEVKIELSLLSMSYVQIREYDLLAR